MRLQLNIGGWSALFLGAFLAHSRVEPALADDRAATWLSVYSDDDGLTVISPQVGVRADLHDEVEAEAKYDVDVISAATVDVVTAASPRGYEEQRHGLELDATWELEPGTALGLGYSSSWENDYRSHTVTSRVGREWLERRLTTHMGASMSFDRVGRSGDDRATWRSLTTIRVSANVAWILDRRTVGEVGYELQRSSGFQASPYRFVAIEWTDGTGVSVAEAVPERRVRHVLIVKARRALGKELYASTGYRWYVDGWGITSHTVDLELQRAIQWDRVILGVGGRLYRQGAANFYQRSYRADTGLLPMYRTADKMLTRSWSLLGGARVEARFEPSTIFETVRAVLKFEVYDQQFANFSPLEGRRAMILSSGVSAEF